MFEAIFDIFDGLLKAGSICGILSPHFGLIASGQGPGILIFASDFFFLRYREIGSLEAQRRGMRPYSENSGSRLESEWFMVD